MAATQLLSWGVLFYGFAVAAPAVTADTGWSTSAVAGAFSVGLLVAGLAAPVVASAMDRWDPRVVLSTGSILGASGVVLFSCAQHLAVLYAAWVVIGLAMSVTLYEPAMAVLVHLDPSGRHRTLATVTVVGGLASTVFAPLTTLLIGTFGWRVALGGLGVVGGAVTATLHAVALPPTNLRRQGMAEAVASDLAGASTRRLRSALLFEQGAIVATTAHLVGLLVSRGVPLAVAGAVLATMGVGKVLGRLALLGPALRIRPAALAAACNAVQLAGLVTPLVWTTSGTLLAAAVLVGAGSGASTVLRPLLVVDLVGVTSFAAVNARLQRSITLARAGAPFVVGLGVTTLGWTPSWIAGLGGFAVAAERYLAIEARGRTDAPSTGRTQCSPLAPDGRLHLRSRPTGTATNTEEDPWNRRHSRTTMPPSRSAETRI